MPTDRPLITHIKPLKPIIESITKARGKAYLVGGAVRDLLLGRALKDIDIEVHGLKLAELESILRTFGSVSHVGKQFGVLMIHGTDVDWALPRRDSAGRKPEVAVDPSLTIEEACRRRDVTMNAMAIDVAKLITTLDKISSEDGKSIEERAETFGVIDPFGGVADLASGTLRAVDKKLFGEDPLRFYRVMQFVGRFEMQPDEELNELCKTIQLEDPVSGKPVARERIEEELKKLFLKSKRPSMGFVWLESIGRLEDTFPEVHALVGTEQRADYHPEGDVFEHTMQALDASAELDDKIREAHELFEGDSPASIAPDKWLLMLAVLCHDLGKPEVSVMGDDNIIHSRDHEKAGVPIAASLLKRITDNVSVTKAVLKLVRHHMWPSMTVDQKPKPSAYKRLAAKLAPEVAMWQLGLVNLCDLQGRNPKKGVPLAKPQMPKKCDVHAEFMKAIREIGIEHRAEEPVLKGRDLMDVVSPGVEMGRLLELAYEIQLEEGVHDRDELKRRVLEQVRS